jgi:hypothetical protein
MIIGRSGRGFFCGLSCLPSISRECNVDKWPKLGYEHILLKVRSKYDKRHIKYFGEYIGRFQYYIHYSVRTIIQYRCCLHFIYVN